MAGLSAEAWVELWVACHTLSEFGAQRIAWPDGGSVLSQPRVTVEVFGIISELVGKQRESSRAK